MVTIFFKGAAVEVIKQVVEDRTLSPAEKVLFAILYCRKDGNQCELSVQELVQYVGVELDILKESLHHLEQGGLIRLKEDCQITDATSFLECTILEDQLKAKKPDVPRP